MTPVHSESMRIAEVAAVRKPDFRTPGKELGHLVQCFFNVNLVKSHKGLRVIATEYDIDLEALAPGQYVGFFNRKRNRVKLFAAGNVYAYLVLPDDQRITMDILRQIPQVFQSKADIAYLPAMEESLMEEIPLTTTERRRIEKESSGLIEASEPLEETRAPVTTQPFFKTVLRKAKSKSEAESRA